MLGATHLSRVAGRCLPESSRFGPRTFVLPDSFSLPLRCLRSPSAPSFSTSPPSPFCASSDHTAQAGEQPLRAAIAAAQAEAGVGPYHPVKLPDLAIAKRWISSDVWNLRELGQYLQGEISVKASSGRWFMYEEVGRPDSLEDSGLTHHHTQLLTLTGREFLSRVQRTEPGQHYYWTTPVARAGDELLRHVEGWDTLLPEDPAGLCPYSSMRPYVSVWIGSEGATTQAHYDVAHNVFVQAHGTKTFKLWPPAAAAALHVFPDAHPRARKAQLSLDRPDLARCPLAARLPPPALHLTLRPGEALYIPAFWFHHVEACSPSVSLNVFSEASTKLAAAHVLQAPPPLPLPPPGAPSPPVTLLLFRRYLREHFLPAVLSPPEDAQRAALKFLEELYLSRYHPLMSSQPGQTEVWTGPDEGETGGGQLETQFAQHVAAFDDHVREVVQRLEGMGAALSEAEEHREGMRDIVVSHLIELWLVRLYGATTVGAHLRYCASP